MRAILDLYLSPVQFFAGVAERIVSRFFNEHFEQYQDPNQFGVTKDRSTVLALVKFCHFLFHASDNRTNFIRVLFVDFTKAFDLINHNVLYKKFTAYEFPTWLTVWSLAFLNERTQFVKSGDVTSSCRVTNAGAPQGTHAGGNDFKLLINYLNCYAYCIKYVDDVSMANVSSDPFDQSMQLAVNGLLEWSRVNTLNINSKKTKEMILHFGRRFNINTIPNLVVSDSVIERVDEFKLLGIVIRADLNWSAHVRYMLTKASKRIFVITFLARSCISVADLLTVYCAIVRSVLEYASPVWHCGLSNSQSSEIERVQKRCLKIIFSLLSYAEALAISGLERLSIRRDQACQKLFTQIKQPTHILNSLIMVKERNEVGVTTRDTYPFVIPRAKTNRMCKSLITYGLMRKW